MNNTNSTSNTYRSASKAAADYTVKTAPRARLSSVAIAVSLALVTTHGSALEALNDAELQGVTGQDGLTVKLALPNTTDGGALDGITADNLQYIEDGNAITLSSFSMGSVDEQDRASTDLNGITTKFDVYSTTESTPNPGVGVAADIEWERIALRNRITFDETDTFATADGDISGTLFDWQWSGSGKLFVKNAFLTDFLEDNAASAIATDDGTTFSRNGATEGYLQLIDNNFNLGNPYQDTALMIRDFDAAFCFHTGAVNVDSSVCADGVTFDSNFAADIGYQSALDIDGNYGLMVSSNRFELDLNLVLAHRTFASESDYNSFAIANDNSNVEDFFGIQVVGPLQNFIAALNGGGSQGASGLRFLLQAENDPAQMVNSAGGLRNAANDSFRYLQPSIRIYEPQAIGSSFNSSTFYNSKADSQKAIRLDNFREFHNAGGSNDDFVPALYFPFTLDIIEAGSLGNTSIDLGSDSGSYNYDLDEVVSPASAALLTIENNLFGTLTNVNGGSGGGVIDLYAEDLNIGTLGTAGNSLGSLVFSIRNLESQFLFTSSRLIRTENGCGATVSATGPCSVDPNALISFGGYGKISESGFGWIDTDANVQADGSTGSKWFLGFRNFGGFIQGSPLENYLYAAKDHRGISGHDGFLFNLNGHLATTDFSFGISKAYDASDYENVLFDIGDVVDAESFFKARWRFFASLEMLLTPLDDGIIGMDATVNFFQKDIANAEKQNLIYFADDDPLADVEFGFSDFRGAFATRADLDGNSGTGVEGEEIAALKFGERTNLDDSELVDTMRLEMPLQVISGVENLPTLSVGFDVQQYGAQRNDEQQELVRIHIPVGGAGVINAEVWGR